MKHIVSLRSVVLVVVLLASLGLTGCGAWFGGSGPVFSRPSLKEGKASLVLYRKSAFWNHRVYEPLQINGKDITTVTNGGWFAVDLEPGVVSIRTQPRNASSLVGAMIANMFSYKLVHRFTAEAGNRYYIRFDPPSLSLDINDANFKATVVKEQEALKELEGLERFDEGKHCYWW